jgi:hypothetical protein
LAMRQLGQGRGKIVCGGAFDNVKSRLFSGGAGRGPGKPEVKVG